MSYWESLPATPGQVNAINSYNREYGVKIHVNNKQQAHELISTFAPVQKLEFCEDYVFGTKIKYDIVNPKKFESYKSFNFKRLKNVESIEIKDGMAILRIRKENSTINTLDSLNKNMGRMMSEVSHSEFEDDLGYLDESGLEREMDIYGSDPMWWK